MADNDGFGWVDRLSLKAWGLGMAFVVTVFVIAAVALAVAVGG